MAAFSIQVASYPKREHKRALSAVVLSCAVAGIAVVLLLSCTAVLLSPALARWIASAAMPIVVRVPLLQSRAGHLSAERVARLARAMLLLEAAPIVAGLLLDLSARGWRQSSLRRLLVSDDPSVMIDVAFVGLKCLGLLTIVALALTLGGSYFFDALSRRFEQYFASAGWRVHTGSAVLDFGIFYLGYSFASYWAHRLEHWGPFWRLHRIHHSATQMSAVTFLRDNPAEISMTRLVRVWVALLVACPAPFLVQFLVLAKLHDVLIHCDARWDWGWFGRWVVTSPMRHRVHHSILPEHGGRNFALCPVWDRVFGTYSGDSVGDTIGITEASYDARHLCRQLIADSYAFFRGLTSSVASLARSVGNDRVSAVR